MASLPSGYDSCLTIMHIFQSVIVIYRDDDHEYHGVRVNLSLPCMVLAQPAISIVWDNRLPSDKASEAQTTGRYDLTNT